MSFREMLSRATAIRRLSSSGVRSGKLDSLTIRQLSDTLGEPVWSDWRPLGDDLDDDAIADYGVLVLRAEQMDNDCWWWSVRHADCRNELASSNEDGAKWCSTAEQARQAAETASLEFYNREAEKS